MSVAQEHPCEGRVSLTAFSLAAAQPLPRRNLGAAADRWRMWLWAALLLLTGVAAAGAQTFQPLPALSFTKLYQGGNPTAQLITVASTGTNFNFSAAATVSSGGNWLSLSANGCCVATPQAVTVTANPDIALAPGTYNGQITFKSQSGAQTLVVPVSLTVEQPSAPFFDSIAGGLTFSLKTGGSNPPSQTVDIRNAGSGVLPWTATTSTADGGGWLSVSTHSGTAPSRLEVSIDKNKLPEAGLVAGTYVGQVTLQGAGDSVTIPVSVTVGDPVFEQINPLYFNKPFQGGDPPPQVITVASPSANFNFSAAAVSSTGGNWLSLSVNGCCVATPEAVTVNVNPDIALAPGTYTAEIIFKTQSGSEGSVVPVSLTVASPTAIFFDGTNGELTFSLVTKGNAPPSQLVPIRNAGAGTLDWTASASTADGGSWLQLSETSGTAPSDLAVSIDATKLPEAGLVAGTYVGQVILRTGSDEATIPVAVTVGAAVFQQLDPLSFTKAFQGGDPPAQVVTVASTGANFNFSATAVSSTGGNWLSISVSGCCVATPEAVTVSVNPNIALAPGSYTAEIIFKTQDGSESSVVPVTLTVAPPTATFFDATTGELTFSLATKGSAPPTQPLKIRNAGTGTLQWTAAAATADGGDWVTLSALSGTAPSTLQVGINPANLPGAGLVAGTYVAQVILQTAGDRVTVPITVTVGDAVIAQLNPLYFTKAFQGGDPPAQVLTVASTGANFNFSATAVSSTGGNWLSLSVNGCCVATPEAVTVSVNPDIALAPGTYTAEIIFKTQDGSESSVVPVTLTVAPPTATFFDAPPGALTFSMIPAGTTPSAQAVGIRNAGTGTLNWTASTTTADGGDWLSVSAPSGTAPATLQVSVNPANLPSAGLVAGTYLGQVLLRTGGDAVSIPVSYTVAAAVFQQPDALSFSKPVQGANPAAQTFTVTSTGANFNFSVAAVNSTGGNWLSLNLNGCCATTPRAVTVTATPAMSLAAGTYFAEIILKTQSGSEASVIPVTLQVGSTPPPPTATGTPVFSPGSGTYSAAQTVTLSDTTPGAVIHYTTDGSAPTASSMVYTGPLVVSANEMLQAVALASGYTLSSVASATYTFAPPTVNPATLNFGQQAENTTSAAITVTFTNPGANALGGVTASITGANASDFHLGTNGCSTPVVAGGSCTISLTFAPTSSGARSAALVLTYSGAGSPLTVPLSGTGTALTTQLTLLPSLTSVTYGQALSATASLSGSPAPTGSLSFHVDSGPVQTTSLVAGQATLMLGVLGAGNHTLSVSYNGDGDYGSTSQTLMVTVAPAVLTVTAANASRTFGGADPALTYALTGFVNGDTAAVVGGSAGLSTSATASSPAGMYPITFATEALTAANYVFSYIPGTLTITSASQSITFPPLPATAVYGQDGPFTLSATASSGLPVTYTVSGPASLSGNVLSLTGAGTITVTATQLGNRNYTAAQSVTQTISVSLPATGGAPELVTTATLSHQPDGTYLATVAVLNLGNGTAQNVVLNSAIVGSSSATPLPANLGPITPGKYVVATVTVPAGAGLSGAHVIGRFTGTYTGGTFGGSLRLTLP